MLLYKCFRFSEVMHQMFITVRGAVQGSFRISPLSLLGKQNGVNRQCRNKSNDQILCFRSINPNRNIQNDRDL